MYLRKRNETVSVYVYVNECLRYDVYVYTAMPSCLRLLLTNVFRYEVSHAYGTQSGIVFYVHKS